MSLRYNKISLLMLLTFPVVKWDFPLPLAGPSCQLLTHSSTATCPCVPMCLTSRLWIFPPQHWSGSAAPCLQANEHICILNSSSFQSTFSYQWLLFNKPINHKTYDPDKGRDPVSATPGIPKLFPIQTNKMVFTWLKMLFYRVTFPYLELRHLNTSF